MDSKKKPLQWHDVYLKPIPYFKPMDIHEYIHRQQLTEDLMEQIRLCYHSVRCLNNTISPDIITVMTLQAWKVFCNLSHTFEQHAAAYPTPYWKPPAFNGSRLIVLRNNDSQFFFYTLCRNLPKP